MSASRLRLGHLSTVLLAVACAGGASSADQVGEEALTHDRYEYTAVHMGTAVRIVVHANDAGVGAAAARGAFDRMAVLEAILSDYQPQSELRSLARRSGEWVEVSEVLFDVLALSTEAARLTDGAFDPTIGPLVALWRRVRDSGVAPSRRELDSASALVGWRQVELDSARGSVRVGRGVSLDLGGVAKGYILDKAGAVIRERGVLRFLIEAGGDIVVGDAPPGRAGWAIAVEGVDERFTLLASSLVNAAISTSGGNEQYVELEGERYSHVIDPATGAGVTHGNIWHVIHADAALADALATALSASGGRNAADLLGRFPGAQAARSTGMPGID